MSWYVEFKPVGGQTEQLRFNEREDYPVVVFHDGLSKASGVLGRVFVHVGSPCSPDMRLGKKMEQASK